MTDGEIRLRNALRRYRHTPSAGATTLGTILSCLQTIRQEIESLNSFINAQLLDALDQAFNAEELRELSYQLAIDYDNLAGSNKQERLRSLVTVALHDARLDELILLTRQKRPNLHI